MLGYKTYVNV